MQSAKEANIGQQHDKVKAAQEATLQEMDEIAGEQLPLSKAPTAPVETSAPPESSESSESGGTALFKQYSKIAHEGGREVHAADSDLSGGLGNLTSRTDALLAKLHEYKDDLAKSAGTSRDAAAQVICHFPAHDTCHCSIFGNR